MRRLDDLRTAHGAAVLAVGLRGYEFDPVGRTAFITSGDTDRAHWLLQAIEEDGVPSAFLFVRGQGKQAQVCCDPLPWMADDRDYLDVISHHFAAVLITGGRAAPGKVN